MEKGFCKPCDREVGIKLERPKSKIWFGILGAVLSFIWLLSQINFSPSFSSSSGVAVSGAPSDATLIIPVGFLLFAIYAWAKLSVRKCSICGIEHDEETNNA
jgi:hypothetical protein